MIRAVLALALLATPAIAEQRSAYWDALEDARLQYLETLPQGDTTITYDVSPLERDGTLVRYVDDDPARVAPQLITVYDRDARVCHWGYEVDAYPAIDRTAALTIRDHAVAESWPDDTIVAEAGTIGLCIGRARLATTVGGLHHIDALRFGELTLIFGFPHAEGTS